MRLTRQVLEVLSVLLRNQDTEKYGLEISRETGYKTGTVYPILDRLTSAGWVEASWEVVDPHQAKRPRRRYFSLTESGRTEAFAALNDYLDAIRMPEEQRVPS